MHLTLDCRSVHQHMGGIGRAALELMSALAENSRGHRLSMIVGTNPGHALPPEKVNVVSVDAAMIDERFEQLHLPVVLEELAPDVYLNSTFSLPAIKSTRYQAAVIHDVVFEDHPEYVEPGLGSYLRKWSRFSAAHADLVLTVSDHAKRRIEEVYGIPSSKIARVYNGIPSTAFEVPDKDEVERVRAEFGLRDPFILYLGSVERKKGIVELIRAFRRAVDSGFQGTLVLAGPKSGPHLDLEKEIRREGCVGRVIALGYVNERDKKPLLKASSAFVYPSLYEGFGLPPLEAMALGVPCVVSNRTSLPEIAGGAALVTPVESSEEFASSLLKALQDDTFREKSATAGPARAREFTWERSATQVLDACELLRGVKCASCM